MKKVSVVLWAAIFTLAYAQSPLYTSNQNQYFLHGLADAGYGFLRQDWLANTLDPTPVFSGLVAVTYRLTHWPPVFYLYFGVLAGVYVFSLMGILRETFGFDDSPARRWLTLTALILFHSALLRYLTVRVFDSDWAYLFDGGVAGQRLLGAVLQPSAFGVLLLLAVYLFLRRKYGWTVLFLVLTPTIHPTYLFTAGMLTLVFMGSLYFEDKKLGPPLTFGLAALLGVSPILMHVYRTFGGARPDLIAESRRLLVHFRIPHHAVLAEWLDASVIVKLVLVLTAIYLARKTRLFHILLWPFGVAVAGTLLQWAIDSDVLALLFLWRQSTWLVPVSTGVIVVWGIDRLWPRLAERVSGRAILAACAVLALGLAGSGLAKTVWEAREKHEGRDRPMMAHVRHNKASGQVYLIPLDMQDFRLETGAPAYVEFKSIPYKDVELIEWYRRVRAAGNFYRVPQKIVGCEILETFYAEGVTHVVLPYDHIAAPCWNLERQYLDFDYEVYLLLGE